MIAPFHLPQTVWPMKRQLAPWIYIGHWWFRVSRPRLVRCGHVNSLLLFSEGIMMKKRSHHYCGRQVHWLTERKSSLIWPWPLHFPMSFFRAWGLGVPQKVFQVQPINNNKSIFFFPATLATNNWQIKGLIESKTSSVHKGQTAAKVASREC